MRPITKEIYLNWYEEMLFWRKFEDKLASVYIQQKVRGFLHLYNGQEAILAGFSSPPFCSDSVLCV
jgi:pyruvate dehydrogenase E1 component alpha subunit